jgi:DNA repair protein RecN (Recombination protein N)
MPASGARPASRSVAASPVSRVTRQVVVVTHLPQIACFADQHVRVRKEAGVARLDVLEDRERIHELSRMLAGLEGSEHGASHAEELLAEAARSRQVVT